MFSQGSEGFVGITYCLNLCEAAEGYLVRFAGDVHAALSAYVAEAQFPSCGRIYVGSSFCVQRFLATPSWFYRAVADVCRAYDLRTTLVLPIPTQSALASVKERLSLLANLMGDVLDEITVNDVGMLEYASREYPFAINAGRLLSRDHRDPRYPDIFDEHAEPGILGFDWDAARKRYPRLRGVELDPVAPVIDVAEAPPGLTVALHIPYCYLSTSHFCESAARCKAASQKFRAEADCLSECLDEHVWYWDEAGTPLVKAGKTLYCWRESQLRGVDDFRLVYAPWGIGVPEGGIYWEAQAQGANAPQEAAAPEEGIWRQGVAFQDDAAQEGGALS